MPVAWPYSWQATPCRSMPDWLPGPCSVPGPGSVPGTGSLLGTGEPAASLRAPARARLRQVWGPGPFATVAGDPSVESFSSPQGQYRPTVASQAVSSQKMNSYLLRHYQAAGNGRGAVGLMPVMVIARPAAAAQPTAEPPADTPEQAEADPQQ